MKLSQFIATEKGIKSRAFSRVDDLYKTIQKADLFNGLSRHYRPKDEQGERLPSEGKVVQKRVKDILGVLRLEMSEMLDVTHAVARGNQLARGNVTVNGQLLLKDVPATTLLTLEKQLVNLRTFADNLPTLAIDETWHPDVNSGLYKTEVTQTTRTQKIQEPLVAVAATEHHPAQVVLVGKDVIAGFWDLTKYSAAMPVPQKEALVRRIDVLLVAVKQAREAANNIEVPPADGIGAPVFDYLFGEQG